MAISVETLQKQINDIKIDLEKLKTETSVDQKKIQARNIETDVATVKETIKKELEPLKSKTDEESIANKKKLEKMSEMLETMETSSTDLTELKANIAKSAEAEKSSEKIDNTADFITIITGISTMKVLVTELQTIINDYLKQKASMGEPEKKVKEQEIEAKKVAIEAKRKEVQDSIDKIKKGRKECKIEDITDADIKKVIIEQKTKEEALLLTYETDLKAVETPTTTTREKVQAGANKARGKVKETADKVREWGIKNPVPAIAATAGVGLLIRGISKLFSKKKKDKKGFWDRWYGKTLKLGLIGTGAARVLRGIFGGKRDFFGLGKDKDNPNNSEGKETISGTSGAAESAKESFESKNPEIKKAYNEISLNINDFYTTSYGKENQNGTSEDDMFGESGFEKNGTEKLPGTVVFMLDNRYANIGDMLNEKAFAGEIMGADINKALVWLRGRTYDQIKTFLAPIASKFDANTRGLINSAKGVDDIANAIKEKPDAEKIITMVFRKSMKVFSYIQNRKIAVERELVKTKLQTDNKEGFNDKKTEDKEIAIDYYLKDKTFYEENIKSDITTLFMSQRMVNFQDNKLLDCGYKVLKDKNLIEAKIEEENQEDIEELDKEKDDLLDKEEDGSDKLSDLKEKLKNGKLESQDQKNLEEFCEDFIEIMETSGKHTYLNKYYFLLEMFNTEADTGEKIYETSEYKKFVEESKKKIQNIIKKSKDGTLTEGDIDALKTTVDDYYVLQKELTTATYEVHQSRDQNNNIVAKITFTIRKGIANLTEGIELVWNGTRDEKVKGGLIIAGNALAVNLIRHPIKGVRNVLKLAKWTAEKGFNITEQLTGKAIRSKLPWGLGARWYNENTLNYAVSRGEISLENAMQVAKKKEWKVGMGPNARPIKTQEELLEYLFPGRKDYAELKGLVTKYKDNKYVMRELVGMKYDGKRYKAKDRLKLDKTKMTFEINPDVLTKLHDIEVRITGFKTQTEKTIFQSMMKHVRSIDQAQDLATMSIDAKYLKYFESGTDQLISAERFGKYLGKYGKKINPEQMTKFMEFFQNAKVAKKLTAANKETIIVNAFKNFSKIESKGFSVGAIDELKLNVSGYEKIANKVKTGINNMLKDLNVLAKNPKMKTFNSGIQSKIVDLTEYEKTITPESIQATKDMGWLDRVTGFGKLSPEGIKALSGLNVLLKTEQGATVLKALQAANKIEDVKDILVKVGIDASKIDDGILLKIAQTKNASKIKNIVNYGSEIQSISTLKKVLTNPTMKAFGKRLGFVGVAIDFAFVGMEANTQFGQVDIYNKYNAARGANMESKAYFDVVTGGLAATAGLLATIGFVNSWNPVGRVSLGVAGVLTVAKEMGDAYYGEIDKFKQNYQDFLKKDLPAIKQDLIYVNNWQTGLDSSFRDKMAIMKSFPVNPISYVLGSIGQSSIIEKAKSGKGTAEDAIHAVIYMEEMQKFPYAMGDLNNDEVRKNPELKALIEQQKDQHQKSVKERFEYTKKTYIDGKSNIISKERLEKAEGIQALDEILRDSRIYQTIQTDESYTNKTDVKGYQKYSEDMLRKENLQAFTKLENIYKTNPNQFYEVVASLPYYESMCNEHKVSDEDYVQITQNIELFKRYIAYKTLGMSVADLPIIEFDSKKIDYDEITNLLLTFGITVTGFTQEEISNENIEYLDDNQISKKYNVSTNLGQNILYEIAKSKYLNYVGTNDITNLKAFYSESEKEIHGIYYNGENRCINEDYGTDNVFGTDAELNNIEMIKHMREHIDDAGNSVATGKMITTNVQLNKEYTKNFVEIIDRELVYRTNAEQYKKEIVDYIKTNSKGKYIELSPDLIIKGIKSGIKNVAVCVYSRDGVQLNTKTTIKGSVSGLI